MNKKEIAKRIADCENELAKLRKELNEPEYGGKRWKPEMDDKYWALTGDAAIFYFPWDGTNEDYAALAIGNVFSTQEAAKFELERRKVIAELSDFAEGDDAVWDNMHKHWYIWWGNCRKAIMADYFMSTKYAGVYFPSKEAALAAVEAVGEERVKKYYLGVKE